MSTAAFLPQEKKDPQTMSSPSSFSLLTYISQKASLKSHHLKGLNFKVFETTIKQQKHDLLAEHGVPLQCLKVQASRHQVTRYSELENVSRS